ncbi:hypothetical protein KKH23_03975 [Patescibacteria group bacterium]|nr:hypothetical protein [Patescibacteria group bacterium]MBU0776751.1 hypothetical protein [Patescibacteria group bacterium]MBU0846324.1 hypothetical protein [Patescibacteria group bacterium]MBU0922716.1 hypothetical protein [Patescibacteria group bacterium]MBU1066233.1 hypothetical protein [Patescibacteria group bacterium]
MNKKRIVTILIVIATIALAGIAVFTAIRLYQLRQEPVAPTAPTSKPKAAAPESCTALTFTLTIPEGPICYEACTDTPDNCSSGLECQDVGGELLCVNPDCPEEETCACGEVVTYACDSACTTDAQCQDVDENYICYATTDTCRHQDFPEEEDCTETATESPTATPTGSPTAEPELPDAGVSYPTIIGGAAGILLILISLALAL